MAANAEGATAEAAWKLVNFMTGKEGAKVVAETSFGVMPGRASAADAWLAHFGEEMKPFVDGAEYAYKWQLPVGFSGLYRRIQRWYSAIFHGQYAVGRCVDCAKTRVTSAGEVELVKRHRRVRTYVD